MVFLVLYDVHQQLHNQFTIEPQETITRALLRSLAIILQIIPFLYPILEEKEGI